MKKTIIGLAVTAILAATGVSAGENYGKLGLGVSDYDSLGAPANYGNDSHGTGFSLGVGHKYDNGVFAEAGYTNYGEARTKEPAGSHSSLETSAVYLKGGYELDVTPEFAVNASAGLSYWTAAIEEDDLGDYADTDSHGFGTVFGIGASYDLTKQLSITADWEHQNADIDVNLLKAGLRYSY